MSTKCTVYIDEAGDLGINRGTQWFVLTAVVINKDAEPHIRNILKAVKKDLKQQTNMAQNIFPMK